MYLKKRSNEDLIEILDIPTLFDPHARMVKGRSHGGEELQEPDEFKKSDLVFPSGEALPKCWRDPDYKHVLNPR